MRCTRCGSGVVIASSGSPRSIPCSGYGARLTLGRTTDPGPEDVNRRLRAGRATETRHARRYRQSELATTNEEFRSTNEKLDRTVTGNRSRGGDGKADRVIPLVEGGTAGS